MAFDAGAAKGRFILDDSQWQKGAKGVQQSNKGMGKSIFLAQVAFAAFQKVLRTVVGGVKDSINKFIEQEKVETQLNSVLESTQHAAGLTKDAILDMADGLQQSTTFGDEAIITAQNLLLTFKQIGSETFPRATETVLDMSQALGQDLKSSSIQLGKALNDPITGLTALQRVGITFSDQQKELIKTMQNTGDIAGAQALILAELESQFGGSAAAARDTFGGALLALQNTFGDVQEKIGGFIAQASRPFIESMNDMFQGIDTFLGSAEGIEILTETLAPLAGIASVAATVFTTLFDLFGTFIDETGTKISEEFTELTGAGNEANVALQILAPVVQIIASGFAVLGEMVGVVVNNISNMVSVVINSAATIDSFFKAAGMSLIAFAKENEGLYSTGEELVRAYEAAQDEAWNTFSDNAEKAGKAMKTFVVEGVEGVIGTIETLIDEIDNFGDNSDQTLLELQASFEEGATFIEDMFEKMKNSSDEYVGSLNDIPPETEDVFEDLTKLSEQWLEQQLQLSETEKETKIRHLQEQAEEFRKVAEDKAAVEEWLQDQIEGLNEETKEKTVETWSSTFIALQEQYTAYIEQFGANSEEVSLAWTDLVTHMTDRIDEFLGHVSGVMGQISGIWNQYYQNQLTESKNDYLTRKKAIEANIKDEDARTKALTKLDEEFAAEQAKIKKEQWQKQKSADIISSIINTALGVTRALSAGFPVGLIMAGIYASLGAAQTALIASQPMPQFQFGGIASPGLAIVGEQGPELVNIGSTSRIFPSEETENILGGAGVTQNITFTGDVNSDVEIERTMQLAGESLQDKLVG